jgi:hypothetical protein
MALVRLFIGTVLVVGGLLLVYQGEAPGWHRKDAIGFAVTLTGFLLLV